MSERDEPSGVEPGAGTDVTCTECGTRLAAGQEFCTRCGAAVPFAPTSRPRLDANHGRVLALLGIATVLVILIALATSGGGDESSDVAETSEPVEVTTLPTEPTTTTTTIPVGAAGSWVVSGADERGYSARITLAVGLPEHADPNETETFYDDDIGDTVEKTRIRACSVTKATDAIVPVSVTITNTTVSFPEHIGLTLYVEDSSEGAFDVQSDDEFTTGPDCTDPDDSSSDQLHGAQPVEQIAAGESYQLGDFLLVLHDYYSPVHPEGDGVAYQSLRLSPVITFGDFDGVDERKVSAVAIGRVGDPAALSFQLVASDRRF